MFCVVVLAIVLVVGLDVFAVVILAVVHVVGV